MVVPHALDRLCGPVRNRQLRQRRAAGRVAKVVGGYTVALAVEVDTRRIGDQREDAIGDRVGFDVPDVIELATFGYDQLAYSVLRIRESPNGIRGRYLGAHFVEARLDGLNCGIALRGGDERLRS